ncbi:MAG: hypothetical protein ACLPID_06230 [Beijerinckiaceae bacterium]
MNEFERFYAALGEMIVRWNEAEAELRALLINLSGVEEKAAWILVAELGAVSLEQALKSAARDLAPANLQSHISGLVDWFSRLREFRNYYTHGVQAQILGGGEGILAQVTAKNGVVLHQESVTTEQLSNLTERIVEFTSFTKEVGTHVLALHPAESSRDWQPRPLREMPPLPDRLQKPRQYLTAFPPRPAS